MSGYIEDEARIVAIAADLAGYSLGVVMDIADRHDDAEVREAARRELKRRELFSAPIKERV